MCIPNKTFVPLYYNVNYIDEDFCQFEFSVTTNDDYRKFLNTWKDEVNILNANTVSGGAIYPVLFDNNPSKEDFIKPSFVQIIHTTYSTSPDSNEYAYQWGATQLNLTLV